MPTIETMVKTLNTSLSYADQPDQRIQNELHFARQLLLVLDQGMDVPAQTG